MTEDTQDTELYKMQSDVAEKERKVLTAEKTFGQQQRTLKQEIQNIDEQVGLKNQLMEKLTSQNSEFTKMKSLYVLTTPWHCEIIFYYLLSIGYFIASDSLTIHVLGTVITS